MPAIVKADTILVSIPYASGGRPPWRFGQDTTAQARFDTLFVRLETDGGLVGWGEVYSRSEDAALAALVRERILPLLIGRDPHAIAPLMVELEVMFHGQGRTGPIRYGLSAVDVALWDLAGKLAGCSVSTLLGGAFTERVPVYASLMRYGDPQAVAAATRQAIEAGYVFVKLHETTVEATAAAVEAAGSRARIMLDANCPWSLAEALHHDRALASLDLLWLEEPIWPPENYAGLAQLRATGRNRIAAGENAGGLHDFAAMIALGAIDVAQPDVAKSGGISELVRIAALCQAHGVDFVPHCALFGPGLVATIHLNATQRTVPLLERLFCDFEAELYGGATLPAQGHVAVPTGPGLGLDPDPATIERYRIA